MILIFIANCVKSHVIEKMKKNADIYRLNILSIIQIVYFLVVPVVHVIKHILNALN